MAVMVAEIPERSFVGRGLLKVVVTSLRLQAKVGESQTGQKQAQGAA